MDCTQAHKVCYGTHMLAVEADDWWLVTLQRLEAAGEEITWVVFRREFLRKYYPESRAAPGQRTSGGDAPAPIVCFKCGKVGHKSTYCTDEVKKCFRCGKTGHMMSECRHKGVVCFNCGEEGHIGSQCQKPKKAQAGGKVFALASTQTGTEDRLIRGTCFINSMSLITIIDTSATHWFIVAECVERLGLVLYSMNGEMVVEVPTKGSVTTSLVCLKCLLSIFDRDFVIDLVYLPLAGLDIRQLLEEEAEMFSLMATLSIENLNIINELPVVREFPEVFPDEIPDVPPERGIEFMIDLVPGTRPVSMALYRMSV
ncbi:uncharacterized protein LOC131648926 [Vicia villosa]|uniref:uncharacterized protein LOC131648926 n=1 Tax=Vicia villosa TaxID=3911 RepID=UPI00273B1CF1|nr:uncharacterized protein LOC131648926 [Vicia villosa]